MSRASILRAEAGFSLVELLIAIVLLAVGALAMGSVLVATSGWQGLTENHLEVVTAAEGKFEELRTIAVAQSADTVQLLAGGSLTSSQANHADSIQTAEGRWIVRRWQVVDGPSMARSVTIRVLSPNDSERTVSRRDFTSIILPSQ